MKALFEVAGLPVSYGKAIALANVSLTAGEGGSSWCLARASAFARKVAASLPIRANAVDTRRRRAPVDDRGLPAQDRGARAAQHCGRSPARRDV